MILCRFAPHALLGTRTTVSNASFIVHNAATIQSLVRGASVRSKNVLPRKPTLTPGAVDVIGDMVDGAITTALSPRGAAPRDDKQEDRRSTLQAETTTYISALCGGAISGALTKSPGTLKRGLGETEVMDIMGEVRGFEAKTTTSYLFL